MGLVLVGLVALALVLWAIFVRPFVKLCGGRKSPAHSLVAPIADFGTCLIYRRGPLPWRLRIYGVVLVLIGADLALAVLLFLFGNVLGV